MAIAAARFYTPLITLTALMLMVTRAPGTGAGFAAGAVFMLALALHALVFGAAAARLATPPALMRALVAMGVVLSVAGQGARIPFAREAVEAGLFLATAGAGALAIAVLFGRAPTMRDHTP